MLRRLASQATSDRAFLSELRKDPRTALAAHGYALTEDEIATVLDLRRRTAALGDGTVAALLAGGRPGNPRAPGGSFAGPGRPGTPGRSEGPEGRSRRTGT